MPPSSYYDASPSTRPTAGTKEGNSSPYYSSNPTSKSCSTFASTSTLAPSYSEASRTSRSSWFLESHQASILDTSSIPRTSSHSGRRTTTATTSTTRGESENYANVTPTVTQVREESLFVRNSDSSLHDFLSPRTKQEKEDNRNDSNKQETEETITLKSMFRTQPSSGVTSSTIISTSTHNASSLCDLGKE
jgi:hypothetical protein